MKTLQEIKKYLKYWYVFVISLVACLMLAFLQIKTSTPKYRITSTLLIRDVIKGNEAVQGNAFTDLNMFPTAKTVDNEMEVLRSRDLIYKVLKSLSMEIGYSIHSTFKKKELYGEKLPFKVSIHSIKDDAFKKKKLSIEILDENRFVFADSTARAIYNFGQAIRRPEFVISLEKGPAFKASTPKVDIVLKNLDAMAESYSRMGLKVMPIAKETNTVLISVSDAIPKRGIDLVTKLIEIYNLEDVHNKNIMARNTIKFIDKRLKYLEDDLNKVEQDVESYKQQNQVTDVRAVAQMNLQYSGDYSEQISTIKTKLGVLNSLQSYLSEPDTKFSQVPSTHSLSDPTLLSLTSRYNDLQMERQSLLRNAKENNPLILNINQQLAAQKSNIIESLKNLKRGLLVERSNLMARASKFDTDIKKSSEVERGLSERSRQQTVKSGLYSYLLQKREETELSLSSTVPTAQVIAKPAFNSTPESPKTTLIYLMALIAGVLIPATGIFIKDLLNVKVIDAEVVQDLPGVKILGELSHREKGEELVVSRTSRTTISELLRYIRANLNYMSGQAKNQVLLITSSAQGEGKTFFSLNLGTTLSMADKKVVLLEFDLRKPDLLANIDLKYTTGITDYLNSSSIEVDDIVQPSLLAPNLSVVPCGTLPDNPSELVMHPKLNKLFSQLRQKFDYIIVDTSPVGMVADAFSLSNHSDASIYIVRYNHTIKSHLSILKDICENEKLKNPMVVFNDAKKSQGAYAYSQYGYATSAK